MIVGKRDHIEEERLLENLNITPPIIEKYIDIADQKTDKIDNEGTKGINNDVLQDHFRIARRHASAEIRRMRRPWEIMSVNTIGRSIGVFTGGSAPLLTFRALFWSFLKMLE